MISVVIPTKDRWARLPRTLRSVLAQTGVAFDVVVVDDGSARIVPPGVGVLLQDGRVRMIRHERSRGVAAARNSGIQAATGKWIAFLDDDDLWAPHKLATQLAAADHADAEFAYCSAIAVTGAGGVLEHMLAPAPSGLAQALRRGPLPAGSSTVIARRSLLDRAGGFDETLSHFADWDLWLRLASLGVARYVHEPLVAYVQHSENMVLTDTEALRSEFDAFVAKHATGPDGVAVSQKDMTRWIAKSHLRAGLRGRAAREYAATAITERSPSDALRAVTAPLGPRAMKAASHLANASRRIGRSSGGSRQAGVRVPPWLESVIR